MNVDILIRFNRCSKLGIRQDCVFASKCLIIVRNLKTARPKYSRWPSKSSRSKPMIEPINPPFEGINIEQGPIHPTNLWKPVGFTIAVSLIYTLHCVIYFQQSSSIVFLICNIYKMLLHQKLITLLY